LRENDFTKILDWPGYRVYRPEIHEEDKTMRLWVRRKRGKRWLECSGCGRKFLDHYDCREREVRDLPWGEFRAFVVVEVYRVRCPDCGVKVEKIRQLPSKAPYSKRFEEDAGKACESAAARQVARRIGLAESTVRAIDRRYLERWEASRRKPPLRHMGVDEIYKGKKETLDEFFGSQLTSRPRQRIEAACVDMWEPFRLSIQRWAPQCQIVYDKFHVIQHANDAVDEVRRAEFFRKGTKMRELVKGKKWLLLSRWKNLTTQQRGDMNRLFQLNRRLFKAYLLKESLERLWEYHYEGAMLNYLRKWIDQPRWQRLPSFQELGQMLLKHLEGILNYCRTKVRFGVVEAINGNIRMLLNRGRGYKNLRYLLLKAKRMAVTNTEDVAFHKISKAA